MPLADRARLDLAALADGVRVEEPPERLQHEQRRAVVSLRLGEGLDDVVWRDRAGHGGCNAIQRLGWPGYVRLR